MPRVKRVRRFDPRFGVSQVAVETEAKEVAREMANYLLLSVNELRDQLETRRTKWRFADDGTQAIIRALPERDRLALQCLLFRDFYHILELYGAYTRLFPAEGSRGASPPEDAPVTPFSEWLFPQERRAL